ncbi:MAG TPA: DUF3592 domain-containing protein [Drouetiella sp.]
MTSGPSETSEATVKPARKSGSGLRFLITGALFLSALVFYAWDYLDGLAYFRNLQQWPITQGTVSRNSLEVTLPSDKPDPLQKTFQQPDDVKGVYYSYVVNGKTYTSNQLVARQPRKFLQSLKMFYDKPDEKMLGMKYPVGSPVEVHFNPEHPEESCLDISAGWRSRYVATCFSALAIVIPTIGFLLASLFIIKAEDVPPTKRE